MKLEMRLYGVSGPDAISTRTPTGEAFFHQFFWFITLIVHMQNIYQNIPMLVLTRQFPMR